MNRRMKPAGYLVCLLLICTGGIVTGNAFPGGEGNSSPDDVIWIDSTPRVSGILKELDEQYPAAQAYTWPNRPGHAAFEIGDMQTFNCVDFHTEEKYAVNATCEAVGERCYIFLEEDQTLDENETAALMESFDTTIYPTVTDVFGDAPDVDGDPRTIVLLLDMRDGSYHGVSYDHISGLFSPELGNGSMIYVDLEMSEDRKKYTMAHEFQHLIHYRHDTGEHTWVNEGCSMYAGLICFQEQNREAIFDYMKQPDTALVIADYRFNYEGENNAHYGASYLWTLYLSENFGDLSNRSENEGFIRDLVASNDTGIQGIDATLDLHGHDERFDDVFKQWVVANYLESEGEDPPLGYASINFTRPPSRSGSVNMIELDKISHSFPEKDMHSWSAAYYEVETDDPEKISYAIDRDFWSTSFADKDGNVIIVISPLNDRGRVTLTVSEEIPNINDELVLKL